MKCVGQVGCSPRPSWCNHLRRVVASADFVSAFQGKKGKKGSDGGDGDTLTRIAIVKTDKCKPKKCKQPQNVKEGLTVVTAQEVLTVKSLKKS